MQTFGKILSAFLISTFQLVALFAMLCPDGDKPQTYLKLPICIVFCCSKRHIFEHFLKRFHFSKLADISHQKPNTQLHKKCPETTIKYAKIIFGQKLPIKLCQKLSIKIAKNWARSCSHYIYIHTKKGCGVINWSKFGLFNSH